MPQIVTMPQLGESVTEGTITRWLKRVGDQVSVDEPLLEVSTDKVDTELPSPYSGVLLAISVEVDQTVAVGSQLAVIGDSVEQSQFAALMPKEPVAQVSEPAAPKEVASPEPAPVAPPLAKAEPPKPPAMAEPPEPPAKAEQPRPDPIVPAPAPPLPAPVAPSSAEAAYVTPLVRRLAADGGVDLAGVRGTGVGGRIRREDVMAAAEEVAAKRATATAAAATTPMAGRTEKMSRLRSIIAERMVTSLQTSAQLTTVVEVDLTRVANLRNRVRNQFEEREGVKLTYLPFIAKAALEAIRLHPVINASIDQAAGTITYHDGINLGIAVDTPRGLLVPVIRDAHELNIAAIARRIADLAARTRDNKVTPDELSGGTFAITNTGSRGALFDTPIINLPNSAILGTGAVVKRPVVMTDDSGSDVIAIRAIAFFAISYDHRLVDGADAARFVTAVKARLEEGAFESELL